MITTTQIHCDITQWTATTLFEAKDLPSAFGKQVIFAVDMDHAVLENTLPFVLDTGNLTHRGLSDTHVDYECWCSPCRMCRR